jgi:drug/metabolite transporter (DMT)-like permease
VTEGVILSAASSLALGINTVVLAVAARRIGTVVAAGATLVLAFVPLLALALALAVPFTFTARSLTVVAAAGAMVAVAYLAAIESLRRGPVSVTGPIGSATGAATVFAAFLLLGERPDASQWAGCAVTASGAVLASVTRGGGGVRLVGLGPAYAVLAVALGAAANVMVRDPIRDVDPLAVIIVERAATIAALALLLVLWGARLRPAEGWWRGPLDRRALVLLGTLGVLDAASFLAFAYALETAPAWLVGVISQSGRALAVGAGFLLFGERLDRIQWCGLALLGAGLGLVSVGSA